MKKEIMFLCVNVQIGAVHAKTQKEALELESQGMAIWNKTDTRLFSENFKFWRNLDVNKIIILKEEIKALKKTLKNYKDFSIKWTPEDFKDKAKQLEMLKSEIFFNKNKFETACLKMVEQHDCNKGITWETIEFFLFKYALTDFYNNHNDYWVEITKENAKLFWNKISIFAYDISSDSDRQINLEGISFEKAFEDSIDHIFIER